jgi:hypothetical protein
MEILTPAARGRMNSDRSFSRRRHLALVQMLSLLMLFNAVWKTGGQTSREHELKAVLLFNLAQFVEWPAASFESTNAPIVIGLLGSDPFGPTLDDVVRSEKIRGRPVVIQRYASAAEVKSCHLLFIGETDRRKFQGILPRLEHQPVLTVSDADGFLQAGGMLQMHLKPDGRLGLRINVDSTKAAGLTVSAKLLRVVEVARREE